MVKGLNRELAGRFRGRVGGDGVKGAGCRVWGVGCREFVGVLCRVCRVCRVVCIVWCLLCVV